MKDKKGFVLGQLVYFIPDILADNTIKQVKEQQKNGNYEYRLEFNPESNLGTHIKHSYIRVNTNFSEEEIWNRLYGELYRSILGFGVKFVNTPEKIKHPLINTEDNE